jgi:hypothetical protein
MLIFCQKIIKAGGCQKAPVIASRRRGNPIATLPPCQGRVLSMALGAALLGFVSEYFWGAMQAIEGQRHCRGGM